MDDNHAFDSPLNQTPLVSRHLNKKRRYEQTVWTNGVEHNGAMHMSLTITHLIKATVTMH